MLEIKVTVDIPQLEILAGMFKGAILPADEAAAGKKPRQKKAIPISQPEEEVAPEAPTTPKLTIEDVRLVCANKSRKGFKDEVKGILSKHGADVLSALPESEYTVVIAEVEAL